MSISALECVERATPGFPDSPGFPAVWGTARHGSHLACSWAPQIICWAQASQQADCNAAAGIGFPNGCAQIKILFRYYGKWRLSGTSNLCSADGEQRRHLGECDTDTRPATCFWYFLLCWNDFLLESYLNELIYFYGTEHNYLQCIMCTQIDKTTDITQWVT